MTVTAEYAASHFDELLAAVEGGSSIDILRPNKPALRLTGEVAAEPPSSGKRILGAGKFLLRVPGDEEWERMDRGWRQSFAAKFDMDTER